MASPAAAPATRETARLATARFAACSLASTTLALAALLNFPSAQPGPVIFDFENGFSASSAKTFGATAAIDNKGASAALAVAPKDGAGWEGATLDFTAKDLSAYQGMIMTVRNTGAPVGVFAHVDDDGNYPWNQGFVWLNVGETDTLYVPFNRNTLPAYLPNYLTGMKGMPGGYMEHWETIDLTKVGQVQVLAYTPGAGCGFAIDDVRPWANYAPPSEADLQGSYFPLLDTLGQFRHADWPGKAAGGADLIAQAAAEAADLAAHPGPADWDQYGGWLKGPALDATGKFRTQKVDGKWWLVDPDGHIFWSLGITCIGNSEVTPVAGREKYFASPPANGDYRAANLKRKFGSTWSSKASALAHQRMRSWGANTFGNWSDGGIYGMKKTPYTVNFSTGVTQTLPASLDTAAFRAAARTALAALKTQVSGDPWCLGVFSDNELNWPSATAAAISEDYYRICSQEIQAAMPGMLYLGSRIHVAPEAVWRSAGKYCDVISHNRYEFTLDDMPLPTGVDKPVMLTEFHFGALDRGLPHPGLRAVFNQRQRAKTYMALVNQCLQHPNLVGAHWFQYSDNVYTGRFDGENYQIGFVDICDRPYPEMTAAARMLSAGMYAARTSGQTVQAIRAPAPSAAKAATLQGPFPKPVDILGRRDPPRASGIFFFR